MQRFNIFNQIHKGLRALLFETALRLQQTDFTNPEQTEPLLEQIQQTLDIFDKHANHEDQAILPVIHQYEPALVDAFEKEHEADHALAEKLRSLLDSFEKASTPAEQINIGHALLHAFTGFTSFNLDHMAKEETVLNERLWRYYSDAELMALSQKIIASIPPAEMEFSSAWIMRGLSNNEITAWLKAVQTNAPESIFNNLFSIAERELPNQRFRQVLEDLTEGAMLA
jgi:hypothetical protein